MSFINYSVYPNAAQYSFTEASNEVALAIYATKDIKKDEEILIDYFEGRSEEQRQKLEKKYGIPNSREQISGEVRNVDIIDRK